MANLQASVQKELAKGVDLFAQRQELRLMINVERERGEKMKQEFENVSKPVDVLVKKIGSKLKEADLDNQKGENLLSDIRYKIKEMQLEIEAEKRKRMELEEERNNALANRERVIARGAAQFQKEVENLNSIRQRHEAKLIELNENQTKKVGETESVWEEKKRSAQSRLEKMMAEREIVHDEKERRAAEKNIVFELFEEKKREVELEALDAQWKRNHELQRGFAAKLAETSSLLSKIRKENELLEQETAKFSAKVEAAEIEESSKKSIYESEIAKISSDIQKLTEEAKLIAQKSTMGQRSEAEAASQRKQMLYQAQNNTKSMEITLEEQATHFEGELKLKTQLLKSLKEKIELAKDHLDEAIRKQNKAQGKVNQLSDLRQNLTGQINKTVAKYKGTDLDNVSVFD